jgi:hypothetical protein
MMDNWLASNHNLLQDIDLYLAIFVLFLSLSCLQLKDILIARLADINTMFPW